MILQVVAKLHAILRPFILRRMKADVELMLPRKKEIILYATLTEHQKNFQDHLVNKTLESYLTEKCETGIISIHCNNLGICILKWMIIYLFSLLNILGRVKVKLNNLMIQLRKNCNHPDLLESAFNGSCNSNTYSVTLCKCCSAISLSFFWAYS